MNRKALFASAWIVALAAFATGAQGQGEKYNLDAGGKPCAGILDHEKNCLDPSITRNTLDRPYRGSLYDPKTYKPSQMPNFVRKGRDLIYIATPGGESDHSSGPLYKLRLRQAHSATGPPGLNEAGRG